MPVDLIPHLRFVRSQGGDGCWGYAGCAVWDILNDLSCPNSPNMSMNQWLMIHRKKELFEVENNVRKWKFYTPDGKYYAFDIGPEFGFFQIYGNPTEGTELTVPTSRWLGSQTEEGWKEASNYRLSALPTEIDISAQSFRNELDQNNPIRMNIQPQAVNRAGHVLAVVGYDEVQQNFTLVDSAANNTGFRTISFNDVNSQIIFGNMKITHAEIWHIKSPRPVPTAIIHVRHNLNRTNLNLWLSIEDSPHPKQKIWPPLEWSDNNRRDLNFKVRLPSEFIWPPTVSNRVVLDLYDSGKTGNSGGEIIEFGVAYGAHLVNNLNVQNNGPLAFNAGECLQLKI